MTLSDKRTKEAMEEGIEYFNRAIGMDPKFALAYAGLTDAYIDLAWFGYYAEKRCLCPSKGESDESS